MAAIFFLRRAFRVFLSPSFSASLMSSLRPSPRSSACCFESTIRQSSQIAGAFNLSQRNDTAFSPPGQQNSGNDQSVPNCSEDSPTCWIVLFQKSTNSPNGDPRANLFVKLQISRERNECV